MSRPPAVVLDELNVAMGEMVNRGKAYAAARRTLAIARADYDRAMTKELTTLRHEYREAGERLPSEEMRRAICHSRIGDEYEVLLAAEAENETMERLLRADQSRISGIQTELKYLQTTELL